MKTHDLSEKQLVQEFTKLCRAEKWRCYPEHEFWDLLLVRRGVVVGVEAKLRFTERGFRQAVARPGVHWRVVVAGSVVTPQVLRWAWHYRCIPLDASGLAQDRRTGAKWDWDSPDDPSEPSVPIPRVLGVPDVLRSSWRRFRSRPSKLIWIPKFEIRAVGGGQTPRRLTQSAASELEFEKFMREVGRASIGEIRKACGVSKEVAIDFTRLWCWNYPDENGRYGLNTGATSLPSKMMGRRIGAVAKQYAGAKSEGAVIVEMIREKREAALAKRSANLHAGSEDKK